MRLAVVALLHVALITPTPLRAAGPSHAGGAGKNFDNSPKATAGERRTGELKMAKPKLEFIASTFARPLRTVEAQYDAPLFQALEKATRKEGESEIATVVARLYGGLDTKQLPGMLEAVQKERKAEEEKAEKKDEKWIAFLDRVMWYAPIATGDKPVAEGKAADFNEAAKDAKKIVEARNKQFNEKLERADTNEQDKKFVKENVDRDAVMAFMASQAKNGNAKIATDLAKALALDGGKGQKFVELIGGDKAEPQRLYLGTNPEEFATSLKVASSNMDNFSNVAWYPSEHTEPKANFFVQGDTFKTGIPEGGAPPEKRPGAGKGSPPPPPDRGADPKTPPKPGEDAGGSKGAGAGGFAAVKAAVEGGSCKGCHGNPSVGASALVLQGDSADSAKLKGKSLRAALEAGSRNNEMPPKIRDEIKALLSKL